jgi:cytochrome c2
MGIEFRRLGYRLPSELKETKSEGNIKNETPFARTKEALTAMEKSGCMNCHSVEQGKNGISLLGVGSRRNASEIKNYITSDAHAGVESAKSLTTQELDDITNYLATLTGVSKSKISQFIYDMGDFISTRGRTRFLATKRNTQIIKNQFFFNDMTFYYLGAVNKFLTIFFETEFEEGFDPNVLAQATLLYGKPDLYGYLKVGNMRLVRQGIGPLDRPKTVSTDLVVSSASTSNPFRLNQDQRGIELALGFNNNRTLIRAFVMNGLDSNGNGRPIGTQDLNTQKDICIMVENLFDAKTTTGLSAVFYKGISPKGSTNFSFWRGGGFGTLALNNKLNYEDWRLNAEYLYGEDDIPNTTNTLKSYGYSVSLDKRLGNMFYVSGRYDYFRPNKDITNNDTQAYTLSFMKQLLTYLRLTAEYQYFKRPAGVVDNRFTAEFFVFF